MQISMSLILFCLTWASLGLAQMKVSPGNKTPSTTDSSQAVTGEIRASVQVDSKQVPQNRAFTYTIEITWTGDLDRFEVENLETPVLSNLEIVGNSSADKVGHSDGEKQAMKKYEFVLSPLELGMAYIDGSVIEYKDTVEQKTRRLVTNRLEVEVTEPVIERDYTSFLFAGAALLLLGGIAALLFISGKRRRLKEAELQAQERTRIPLEETYLAEIRESIDLKSQDQMASFSALSRLLRKYLSERYQIKAVENTTKEITRDLRDLSISEKIVEQAEEVLSACDVAKFSGGQTESGVLERIFTLAEEILNQNKADYIELN